EAMLASCNICPWDCRVNRLNNQTKVCVAGYLPIVSSWAPHFGEEPALSGTHLPKGEARGAGNIFFGHCNLRCVYCQNWQISQNFRETRPSGEVSFERLAEIMLELQEHGCHNIGLVSPTHFVPQIVRALVIAARQGLRLPLVYNTNAYDSVDVLRLLDGIVDIYLPDLKYADNEVGRELSRIPDYVERARAAIAEMYRQTGDELLLDERGLLRRGLVIRLLILPNDLAGVRESLEWIRQTLSPRVTLSIMTQYFPTNKVSDERFPLLNRKIREREYERVLEWLEEFGFENGWIQPLEAEAASYYRPDFRDREMPFPDARDFLTT
ncbi:MAG: radical SAM protein, partial [Bryobacteraceae bacterium]|nr:radical SAM protein [Bryobacteraceae bacterium]